MARTKTSHKRKGRPAKTKAAPPMGYEAAAAALECDIGHLWRVLNNKRKSHSLMRRYREYLSKYLAKKGAAA
jgi:hypothetical protein